MNRDWLVAAHILFVSASVENKICWNEKQNQHGLIRTECFLYFTQTDAYSCAEETILIVWCRWISTGSHDKERRPSKEACPTLYSISKQIQILQYGCTAQTMNAFGLFLWVSMRQQKRLFSTNTLWPKLLPVCSIINSQANRQNLEITIS